MNHSMNTNHYVVMFIIMLISGLITTMNVYVDKISDIRLSINDLYMTLLMTGWMFAFMGIYYMNIKVFLLGLCLVIFNIWAIRTQFLISQKQFLLGMIPHHSMAVHLSKKLLGNMNSGSNSGSNSGTNVSNDMKMFLDTIISTQNKEIDFMKTNI